MSMSGMRSSDMPILSRILAVLLLCAGLFCLGQQAFAGPSNDPNFVNGVVKKSCASQQCLAQCTMLLCGAGKGAPGGGTAFGISFVSDNASTAGTASYTFTAQNIGTADPTRIVVVGLSTGVNNVTVSSVTIAGSNAAQATSAASGGASVRSDIWYLAVPSGTTADIIVTFSSLQGRVAIFIYNVVGTGAAFSAGNNGSTASGTSMSASVTVPSGGGAIGIGNIHSASASSLTGTNLALDLASGLITGSSTATVGHDTSHTGSTSYTFGWTTTTDGQMSLAAFSP